MFKAIEKNLTVFGLVCVYITPARIVSRDLIIPFLFSYNSDEINLYFSFFQFLLLKEINLWGIRQMEPDVVEIPPPPPSIASGSRTRSRKPRKV